MSVDQIAAGREAWSRIHHATNFAAWKVIATALSIGRQHSLRLANVNRPFGSKYARAFNAWLDANGFSSMPYGTRSAACALIDNIAAIESWRASLTETERASQSHPETIMRHWRRATAAERQKVPSAYQHAMTQRVTAAIEARRGRHIFWPQSSLRRAHEAMLKSRSSDLLTLARVALEAAVPDADTLVAILNETPPTHARATSPKREPAQASQHA